MGKTSGLMFQGQGRGSGASNCLGLASRLTGSHSFLMTSPNRYLLEVYCVAVEAEGFRDLEWGEDRLGKEQCIFRIYCQGGIDKI